MSKNIYPCFICGQWFDTKGEQKTHKCGSPVKQEDKVEEEVKEEVVEVGETPAESTENTENSEEVGDTEFNRKETVKALIEAGVIADGRSVSRKTDEELAEMLEA